MRRTRWGRMGVGLFGLVVLVGACGSVEPTAPPNSSGPDWTTGADTEGTDTDTDTDAVCVPGTANCPCAEGPSCEGSLVCTQDVCVDPDMACPIGSEGCPCTAGGACDPGLTCLSDVCVNAVHFGK